MTVLSFRLSVFSSKALVGSQSYKDLIVWQEGLLLCTAIFEVCSKFPTTERYGLADQMKRAAVSIPSNIAEGQARRHINEFAHFLSIAKGSLAELGTQRLIAQNLGFISTEQSLELELRVTSIKKMLYSLIESLKRPQSRATGN